MAVANTLKQEGFEPVQTDTTATCTLASNNGGKEITKMRLHVRGEVPGIDQDTFHRIVMEADRNSPVSNLLRDGLEIEITSALI